MAKEKTELELARIKREREEIAEIESQEEADNEARLKKRLEAIQKKWDERQKKKSNARAKSERLTRDSIADDVLALIGLQDDFEKCENLKQFDALRDKVSYNVNYFASFYALNKDVPGLRLPNLQNKEPAQNQ